MKLGACILLLVLAGASPEVRYFRYERPVQIPAQRAGQTCLALDAGIFAHAAAPQLADVRLYRDGSVTPFVIRVAAPVEATEKPVEPLNVGERGGQTVFDAELPDGRYSDLQLAVAAQNFIATITVTGSRDKTGSGETRLGTFTIFDLTRQRLGRSTVLHLPETDFRSLHFRIAGPLSPQSITGLTVVRLPAGQQIYETVAESSSIVKKGRSSVLEFTVPARVPVDRIAFTPGTEPAMFSRDVSISVAPVTPPTTDGAEPEQAITTSGSLLRVHSMQDGKRIDEERLTIDAPGEDLGSPTKWTITIDNGDDAPLKLESVRLEMQERNLCFDAAANARYTLFYGDPALTTPQYDYAALFAPQADTLVASSGPEQPNPAYQSRPDDRPFTEKHPALLWVALVGVIALLGGIALRSAKRTTETPS